MISPVCVQYYKNDILVLYKDIEMPVAKEFARSIMEEYMRMRHPYLLYKWEGDKMMGVCDTNEIAIIDCE